MKVLLAEKTGLNEKQQTVLMLATPLHDVGKIAIPNTILHKPEKLTQNEFEQIKAHTDAGYKILIDSTWKTMQAAAVIALQHHERWDGKGYPAGPKVESIDVYARITCLADTFDVLLHDRIYQNA